MTRIPEISNEPLNSEQLHAIIKAHLPAWLKACATDSDAIVVHEAAFDMSARELFLFACAIKYAARAGKMVHVTCGGRTNATLPEAIAKASLGQVFRERKQFRGRKAKT